MIILDNNNKKNKKSELIMAERIENHKKVCAELEAQGYKRREETISIVKANVLAFATAGPIALVFIALFVIFGNFSFDSGDFFNSSVLFLIFALATFISIPVHEGIHGLGWVVSCKNKFKSIEFGFIAEKLTPYCHCREALPVGRYYLGLLAPLVILGIIPSVISIFTGNLLLLAIGVINILSAGGDTTIGCLIFKYIGKNTLLADHPSECGCVAFEK